MDTEHSTELQTIADYPIQIQFAPVAIEEFQTACSLVSQESQVSNKWLKVYCHSVERFSGDPSETMFKLKVKPSATFDWTIEGAVAFCLDDISIIDQNQPPEESLCQWYSQVIEFDEEGEMLYVDIDDPDSIPKKGWFYICPFDFHHCINRIYNDPSLEKVQEKLSGRLGASGSGGSNRAGSVPTVTEKSEVGLPELQMLWKHRWGILWGPPGTGKTYHIGNQVASVLADIEAGKGEKDEQERILIVSTTNRAVDAVAIELGKAAQVKLPGDLEKSLLLRVGKGAKHRTYEDENLLKLLEGSDVQLMKRLEELRNQWNRTVDTNKKLILKRKIEADKFRMRDAWKADFLDPEKKVICTTVFGAIRMLTNEEVVKNLENGQAPFTTVFIDEAGLISRTTCAALSLLGSRRIVLSGDSRQLSPISRISRIHPPKRAMWIVSSGLSHLDDISLDELPHNVHFLNEQRRMHPQIGEAISVYMYDKKLQHHSSLTDRPFAMCHEENLRKMPRTLWCVLDKVFQDKSKYRANKGPGNRSWIREGTEEILERLFSYPVMREVKGLFISPFLPQAKRIQKFLAKNRLQDNWSASTVHSQQGQQAEMVIFDTVNAGSTGWSHQEWKRLVNVAVSRAQHMVLLLASREEMEQSYLSPLIPYFQSCIFNKKGDSFPYEKIDRLVHSSSTPLLSELPVHSLGRQIQERKQLRPFLSQEQQRLCNLKIDGSGPRLVRGVAGSGKTVVLAEWVVQCLTTRLRETPTTDRLPYWVVYANNTLKNLIGRFVKEAWEKENPGRPFPEEHVVKFLHINDVLDSVKFMLNLRTNNGNQYDYDGRARELLDLLQQRPLPPFCEALFIDEGQDMGENTLRLLFSLVACPENKSSMHKPAYILYDNAQNLYNRSTPVWKNLGIDLRGRSTVMRESYRSTRQIAEFALNVLYRLKPEVIGSDEMELIPKKLIRKTHRNNEDWWRVHFNNVEGEPPEVMVFENREKEFQHLGSELAKLITNEKVNPRDICILYNNKSLLERYWKNHLEPQIPRSVRLQYAAGNYDGVDENTILMTSPQSFKGFEAEIVFIPAADLFIGTPTSGEREILTHSLYVAMTRARGLLKMSAITTRDSMKERIVGTLKNCFVTAYSPEEEEWDRSEWEDEDEILIDV